MEEKITFEVGDIYYVSNGENLGGFGADYEDEYLVLNIGKTHLTVMLLSTFKGRRFTQYREILEKEINALIDHSIPYERTTFNSWVVSKKSKLMLVP